MKITGNLEVKKSNENDFNDVTEVKGNVNVIGKANFNAPKLKTIGDYINILENSVFNAPKLKTVRGEVSVSDKSKLNAPKLNR